MEQTKIAGSQSSQPSQTARAKAPTQQSGGTDGANANALGGGGFFALLTAMDDVPDPAVDAAVPDSAEPLTGLTSDDPMTPIDASLLAAWQGLFNANQGITSQNIAGNLTEGAVAAGTIAAVSAGALGKTDGAPSPVSSAIGSAFAAGEGALDARSNGWGVPAPHLDNSEDPQGGQAQATVSGFSRAPSRQQGIPLQRVGNAFVVSSGQVGSEMSSKRMTVLETAAAVATNAVGERAAAVLQLAGATAGRSMDTSRAPSGTELSSALTGSVMELASVRSSEPSGGARTGDGRSASGSGPEDGSAFSTREMGNVDSPPVFAEANLMGAEDQVAEQVAYWVNQKTQNAQLTLDRDGQPVEVSVSLSGNEAHVSFRSDQPETRALLDQSMAQLRDLLGSEGLVLSGMSVNTSTRDGSPGGRQPRQSDGDREITRQAQVVVNVPLSAPLLAGGGRGMNRTVDIFV